MSEFLTEGNTKVAQRLPLRDCECVMRYHSTGCSLGLLVLLASSTLQEAFPARSRPTDGEQTTAPSVLAASDHNGESTITAARRPLYDVSLFLPFSADSSGNFVVAEFPLAAQVEVRILDAHPNWSVLMDCHPTSPRSGVRMRCVVSACMKNGALDIECCGPIDDTYCANGFVKTVCNVCLDNHSSGAPSFSTCCTPIGDAPAIDLLHGRHYHDHSAFGIAPLQRLQICLYLDGSRTSDCLAYEQGWRSKITFSISGEVFDPLKESHVMRASLEEVPVAEDMSRVVHAEADATLVIRNGALLSVRNPPHITNGGDAPVISVLRHSMQH